MISANEIRKGDVLNYSGKLYRVYSAEHVKPGKGGAFAQVEMKGIEDGQKLNVRFNTSEKVEKAFIDSQNLTFSYQTGDVYTFINDETYEQYDLPSADIDVRTEFITEGTKLVGDFFKERLIGLSWPNKAAFVGKIVETEAYIKGQTAKAGTKPAILENGAKISVPTHIEVGTEVTVDPNTGEYTGRA